MLLCIIAIVFRTLKVFVLEPISLRLSINGERPNKNAMDGILERLINEFPTGGCFLPGNRWVDGHEISANQHRTWLQYIVKKIDFAAYSREFPVGRLVMYHIYYIYQQPRFCTSDKLGLESRSDQSHFFVSLCQSSLILTKTNDIKFYKGSVLNVLNIGNL